MLAALDEEVVDGHEDLASLGNPVASLLGDLVSLGKQVSLVLVEPTSKDKLSRLQEDSFETN